jgi:hypothetical protein
VAHLRAVGSSPEPSPGGRQGFRQRAQEGPPAPRGGVLEEGPAPRRATLLRAGQERARDGWAGLPGDAESSRLEDSGQRRAPRRLRRGVFVLQMAPPRALAEDKPDVAQGGGCRPYACTRSATPTSPRTATTASRWPATTTCQRYKLPCGRVPPQVPAAPLPITSKREEARRKP